MGAAVGPDPAKAFELWAAEKSSEPWLVAAARVGQGWPVGLEMTEGVFNKALEDAALVESAGCYPARRPE